MQGISYPCSNGKLVGQHKALPLLAWEFACNASLMQAYEPMYWMKVLGIRKDE